MSNMYSNVVILLPLYKPNFDFLLKQIMSLKNQTFKEWNCYILIDGPSDELGELYQTLDSRFQVYKGSRLGVYANIERGLSIAFQNTSFDYFFFCDQDDLWDSNKLEVQINLLSQKNNSLVHSDLREINEEDLLTSVSVWSKEQRSSTYSIMQLITRNSITGCTMGFSRKIAELALPFPKQPDQILFYHDLWIGLVAAQHKSGAIYGIPKALVSYRQHSQNVVGSLEGVYHPSRVRYSITDFTIRRRLLLELWVRESHKIRRLWLFFVSSNFLILVFLVLSLKALVLRQPDARLKLCLALGGGLSVAIALKNVYRRTQKEINALLFNLGKKFIKLISHDRHLIKQKKITTLDNFIFDSASGRPRLLGFLPSLNEASLFGGATTLLKLALTMRKNGYEVVLFSADQDLDGEVRKVEMKIAELCGFKDTEGFRIEDRSSSFKFTENDIFLASAWWNAAGIQKIISDTGSSNKFFYLIQDFEPGFYNWSSDYARSFQTYADSHIPIYNSAVLKDFFIELGIGITDNALVLNPQFLRSSIIKTKSNLKIIRVVFYARPSVARNLFEIGYDALLQFTDYLKRQEMTAEFIFVGEELQISNLGGFEVISLGKISAIKYAEILSTCDIGLSLMLSPHPSYPPFEFLDAGIWTVTNSFWNKNKDTFPQQIIVCEPTSHNLVEGLIEAHKRLVVEGIPKSFPRDFFQDLELTDLADELDRKYLS